jgi:hypothetical protein
MWKEPVMCYLARQHQAEAGRDSPVTPPSFNGLRPRWIGAAAATLVGGLALAAFVAPSSTPRLDVKEPAAPAPIVARTTPVPLVPVVEQGSAPLDDGVPTSSDVAKAGADPCHHGL